jgi:hypothetical protein
MSVLHELCHCFMFSTGHGQSFGSDFASPYIHLVFSGPLALSLSHGESEDWSVKVAAFADDALPRML